LLVGAVDGLSGNFHVFDLSKMASELSGVERLDCYTAALIASASVPVIFRQTTINGRPWLDGGLRHSMFLPSMVRTTLRARANAKSLAPDGAVKTDRKIYALKNGTLEADSVDTLPAKLLPTIGRLRTILFNQLELDSIELANVHAGAGGFELYTTSADGWHAYPACAGLESGVEDEIFDPKFMECMIAYGNSKWADGKTPWVLVPPPPKSAKQDQ
jgi:hypothetical protein